MITLFYVAKETSLLLAAQMFINDESTTTAMPITQHLSVHNSYRFSVRLIHKDQQGNIRCLLHEWIALLLF